MLERDVQDPDEKLEIVSPTEKCVSNNILFEFRSFYTSLEKMTFWNKVCRNLGYGTDGQSCTGSNMMSWDLK